MKPDFEAQFLDYLEGKLNLAERQVFESALSKDSELATSLSAYKRVIEAETALRQAEFPKAIGVSNAVVQELKQKRNRVNRLSESVEAIGRLVHSNFARVATVALAAIALVLFVDQSNRPVDQVLKSASEVVRRDEGLSSEEPLKPNKRSSSASPAAMEPLASEEKLDRPENTRESAGAGAIGSFELNDRSRDSQSIEEALSITAPRQPAPAARVAGDAASSQLFKDLDALEPEHSLRGDLKKKRSLIEKSDDGEQLDTTSLGTKLSVERLQESKPEGVPRALLLIQAGVLPRRSELDSEQLLAYFATDQDKDIVGKEHFVQLSGLVNKLVVILSEHQNVELPDVRRQAVGLIESLLIEARELDSRSNQPKTKEFIQLLKRCKTLYR